MHSEVCPYPETGFVTLATHIGDFVADPFGPFVFENSFLKGDLAYEYLAPEVSGTPSPPFFDWSPYSPSIVSAYTGFVVPPFQMDNIPFFPASSLSPLPQEPPSPEHDRQSPPKPTCSQGKPSFNRTQKKWSCGVCGDVFYDKYECKRHIGNAGKQAMCLACGKTICARKDNQKRHYTKYCKRVDIGRDGDLSLEDAFIEV